MYEPNHLSHDDAEALYREALRQAEAVCASAWINYVRAREAQRVVEDDLCRVLTVVPPSGSPVPREE